MKSIGAAKFKEQCLSILDNLDSEGIIITKHDKPVATLMRIRTQPKDLIGKLKGEITINSDILSTGVHWHAQS